MSIIKKFLLTAAIFPAGISSAQDYFNPLFLGSDIASIADLTYLNQGNEFTPGEYYLDLYVGETYVRNIFIKFYQDAKTQKVLPCLVKDILTTIPFNQSALKKLDLANESPDECIKISAKLPNTSYKVDLTNSSLRMSIPQIFLSAVYSTLAPEKEWNDGITTYLMNYSFSGAYSKNKHDSDYQSYYLSMNNKVNWGAWRLYGSGYWNANKSGSHSRHEFNTNSIYLARPIAPLKSSLTLGQSSLGSNLFDSISYIGMGLTRAGDMLADSEKGYSPPIRGIVDSRSKITIRQNGSIIYQTYVDPGPYNITDLNPVGSSGDYQVEVTAANGTVATYSVPYATVTNLLTEGNFDYSFAIGKLDENDSSKKSFVQSSFSYGLPNRITAYMGTQLSSKYKAFGFGLAHDFGYFGGVSIDAISSQAHLDDESYESGQSYRLLYSKNFLTSGTSFQLMGYRYSTAGYYSFSEASSKISSFNNITGQSTNRYLYGRRKSTFQANFSQNLGNYGQVYIWGDKTDYWGTANSTNLQFGWSKTFDVLNGLSVNATFNNYKYEKQKNNSIYLSLNLPLSSRSSNYTLYASNSSTYNTSSHDMSNNTSLYGNGFDNKLSYGINQSLNNHGGSSTTGINATYSADIAKLSMGVVQASSSKQVDYGIAGSLLAHSGGIVFSREISDTAVLVEAKGAAGARITRQGDNIVIGKDGYALIPYVQPYHYNDVELDPGTFSDTFDIQDKVLKTVPTQGAITKIIFDVLTGYNFLITLEYQGQPVPFGALVLNTSNKSTAITNDDSTVYLTGVENNSSFSIQLTPNTSCTFKVSYGDNFIPNMINKRSVTCL
ncbi:fimbria/pilus outer membrane usher protein [Orbus sturtevantii]|uniref:fimbria/pilus outer membrane usher protein n=1 Tax=Orbus sturtevantii TaxID=3074109 RepID=UPI00370D7787